MTGGRPIRFLAVVIGGWAALRALALWPVTDPIAVVGKLVGAAPAAAAEPSGTMVAPPPRRPPGQSAHRSAKTVSRNHAPVRPMVALASPSLALPRQSAPSPPAAPAPQLAPPLVPAPVARGPSRLAGSAWLIARGDGSGGSLSTSQLGASQAGARLTYALGAGRRLALSARIAAPLQGRGAEAGLGIDWQPTAAPIHLIVEQRIALDGGRGGPAALIVGGFGPIEPVRGVRVEAYGQAGAIHRDRVEPFADGAARIAHPVATLGTIRLDLGAGAWGGAQRGAQRLDVGPTLGLGAPIAGRNLRINLDWRQRIAGRARPGSGPALSLGSDF